MRWYCTVVTVRVRYVFCTMPNGGTARALLAHNIQSGLCFILLYTVYILYTYVLQFIIKSTIYTIVPVIVYFLISATLMQFTCIFIKINAVNSI